MICLSGTVFMWYPLHCKIQKIQNNYKPYREKSLSLFCIQSRTLFHRKSVKQTFGSYIDGLCVAHFENQNTIIQSHVEETFFAYNIQHWQLYWQKDVYRRVLLLLPNATFCNLSSHR